MKVDAQPAFVLHTRPYLETSLIVDIFSRDFGRVALLARGARRARAAIRGLIMAFQPLELSWSGKNELKTLVKAEWQGGLPLLQKENLFCAYYLNELLLNVLPKEDAHSRLYTVYSQVIHGLADSGHSDNRSREILLRRFEKNLLQEMGYGLSLHDDHHGMPLCQEKHYIYRIEKGAELLSDALPEENLTLSGQTLLDMALDDFSSVQTRRESKKLMRSLIAHHLPDITLYSRKIFRELQEL